MGREFNITDTEQYNTRMAKSMIDKLFFVDKIETDAIVDFGCADGTTLNLLAQWMPETQFFFGYDNDTEMIRLALHKATLPIGIHPKHQCVGFYDNWEGLEETCLLAEQGAYKPFKTRTLLLSSIVHEVCHYSTPEQVNEFWDRVFKSGFEYIVLRDMMPSASVDRPAFPDDIAKVYAKFYETKELTDFERHWGSIENNKNLLHFLLKYKYTQPNWEREVKENYIPIYRENFMSMIPRNYRVIYHEHYPLPYLSRQIRNDFGIELKDNTHLKIILERC